MIQTSLCPLLLCECMHSFDRRVPWLTNALLLPYESTHLSINTYVTWCVALFVPSVRIYALCQMTTTLITTSLFDILWICTLGQFLSIWGVVRARPQGHRCFREDWSGAGALWARDFLDSWLFLSSVASRRQGPTCIARISSIVLGSLQKHSGARSLQVSADIWPIFPFRQVDFKDEDALLGCALVQVFYKEAFKVLGIKPA